MIFVEMLQEKCHHLLFEGFERYVCEVEVVTLKQTECILMQLDNMATPVSSATAQEKDNLIYMSSQCQTQLT